MTLRLKGRDIGNQAFRSSIGACGLDTIYINGFGILVFRTSIIYDGTLLHVNCHLQVHRLYNERWERPMKSPIGELCRSDIGNLCLSQS
jgi:hypothetical protein